MTPAERKEFIRRIRTPLTPQQVYELRKQGVLQSPIKYKMCTEAFRTDNGKHLCDVVYDTDTTIEYLTFKQGKEYFRVPIEELINQLNDIKRRESENGSHKN